MQPRWFEAAFGFAERDHEQTRDFVVRNVRQLPIGGDSVYPVPRLQFKRHNSDEWLECGHFEVLTVGQLRSAVDAAIEKLKLLRGAVPHEWRLLNAKGEAMALHADPSNAGAVFQVASQLNCLEFQHSRVVPEMGLTNYYRDKTQGPACAIACGAGLLYRQYVHRVKPSSAQLGQTKDNQINLLDSTEALLRALAPDKPRMPWVVRNGYVDADPAEWESWRAVLERESTLAALVDSMAVGVQWDTQVTLDQCSHLVTQVYTSAVPVAHSVVLTEEEWEPFARAVLCGAYEATLLTAVLNHLRAGSTGAARVFLTSVGGGAFGNPAKWIVEAMERAFLRVGAHFRSYVELHAVIVHHAWPPPAEFERFMHGGVAEPSSAGLPIMNSTPAPHSVAPPVLGCNKNPSTEAELPPATVSSVHPDKSTALMKQLQNADGASPNMVAHKARTSPAEPVPTLAFSPAVLQGMQRSDDALAGIASVDPPTETLRGGFTANIDGCRVELRLGDLTAEECDAIVVPTTKHLTHPSAVGAAILQAADANVLASDVRHALAARGGKLKPYDAVATASSGRLMCRCLIHSYVPLAAPSCDYQYAGNVEALCAAFSNILHLASEHALATVALPALGTGGGEYTHEECAAALATAVADHTRVALPGRRVTSVRAVFLSKPELDLFEAAFRATLQVLLPPTMALAAPPVRSVAPRTVSLCVATFNLLSEPNYQHHAKPPQVNVRQRLGAMPYLTAQLQGAQIISLQEVAPGCPISDAFAKQLGNHLEIIRSNARGEGPALAYNRATWSAEQPTFYPLNGHGTKGVICARMEPWDMLLFAPLIFVACHLPWFANDAEIREMLQKVHTHVNAYQRGHRRLPVVLAGDFNIDIRDSRTGPLLRAAFPPTHWEIVTGSLLMTSLSPHGQERVLDHIIVSRGESLTLEKTYTIPPYEERHRLVPHARPPAGPPSQPFVSDHMACVAVLKQ